MNFTKYFAALVFIFVCTVFAAENPSTTTTTTATPIEHLKSAMIKCSTFNDKGTYVKCMKEEKIKDYVAEAAYEKKELTLNIPDTVLQEIIDTKEPPKTELSIFGYVLMGLAIVSFLAIAAVIVHYTVKPEKIDL